MGWLYAKYIAKCTLKCLAYPFLASKTHKQLFSHAKRNRIASDDFPHHTFFGEWYCGGLMFLYSAIFVCAWPFYFPTAAERTLWRIASMVTLGFTFPLGAGLMYLDYVYFGRSRFSRRERSGEGGWNWVSMTLRWKISTPKRTARTKAMRHHLSEKPWLYYMPWGGRAWVFMMMVLYCIARAYILAEDLAGLRRLPSSAFETVLWTQYLPQI